MVRVAAGLVVTGALYGAAGTAIGALTRNVATAAVGSIVWFVVAEGVLGAVAGWNIARFLPGHAEP